MIPYPRALAMLLGLACVAPASATATQPSPGNSTVPACTYLVGSSGGVPATAAGKFTVTVRDLANNPVVGAHVVVDLSGCPDLHICADQLDPAVDIDCANKRVGKFSDQNGMANFTLLGGSNGGAAVTLLGGAKIYENGTLIGSPTIGAFDLDGSRGVGINDLSVWITDFGTFGNPAFGRSDYDCSGSVGINDLSVWLTAFGRGDQTQSCGATCP